MKILSRKEGEEEMVNGAWAYEISDSWVRMYTQKNGVQWGYSGNDKQPNDCQSNIEH